MKMTRTKESVKKSVKKSVNKKESVKKSMNKKIGNTMITCPRIRNIFLLYIYMDDLKKVVYAFFCQSIATPL